MSTPISHPFPDQSQGQSAAITADPTATATVGATGIGAPATPPAVAGVGTFWHGPPPPPPPTLQMPVPLREHSSAKKYPAGALPPIIQEAILEVVEATQAPLPLVAASALSVVSACVQGLASVQRDALLSGPASLYFLTIAASGERKSTCDSLFSKSLRAWERGAADAMKHEVAKHEAAEKAWKAVDDALDKELSKAAKSGSVDHLNDRLLQHAQKKPKPVRIPELIRMDDTPEALAAALARWPVTTILSAEGGLIFGAHGMNPESVTRNLAQLNAFWGGERVKRNRTTTTSVDIEGMRVTVGLQVQREVLDEFLAKAGSIARGSGYLARFLVSLPPSTMGTRLYQPPKAEMPALARFHSRVTDLLNLGVNVNEDGVLTTRFVRLDAAAQEAWIWFHDLVECEIARSGIYFDVKDIASKAAENAARLACCFHVFDGTGADAIGESTMLAATNVITWYLDEATRFYSQIAVPETVRNAEALERWLIEQLHMKGMAKVNVGTILQLAPPKLRKKEARDAALALLVAHHRVFEWVEGAKSERFVVLSPQVADQYRR